MPEVTVLTAVRNDAKYLPETIASIQAQTFTDWEYLLVDDASEDQTPELIERQAESDRRIRLIRRNESGGPYVAANEGLRQARGRYIIRTDSDDVSFPRRIQTQVSFLKENPSLKACAAFCQAANEVGPIPSYVHRSPQTSGTLKWYLCLSNPLIHSSACVMGESFEALGGYRELPLSQDYRLWCDLVRKEWLGVIPEVLVYFRRHAGRVSVTRRKEQRSLAIDILRDHVEVLTERNWRAEEIEALYAAGRLEPFPIHAGLAALDLWDQLWVKDQRLTAAERVELAGLSAKRRRSFIRGNAKQQPLDFFKHIIQYLAPDPRVTP